MKKGISAGVGFATSLFLVLGMGLPLQANAEDDPCLSSTVIIGTPGDDVITGTPGDDIICTYAGNDTIEGLAGDDVIIAGDGDDRIIAMEGNDYIEAGDGDDFVDAGAGNDEILGNPGDDILWGGLGIDEILGLAGNDSLDGGVGADSLDGGLDRNYCVKDPKDEKALSCFYDTKAPVLKSFSVSANSRSIDTSITAQWVRVKALITEAGSGLTEVGFVFVNWQSKTHSSFGETGSLKYPDRMPTSCASLNELSKTPPPNTANPKSHWCIEQQNKSAVLVEFLIAAPYRLAKGTYSFSGINLTDGALNQSDQNGANFNVSVKQTATVPTGIPVLKSFAFVSPNKINTETSSQKISAEATFSVGPVGLGYLQILFQRDVDRKFGDNPINFLYNVVQPTKSCDPKIDIKDITATCIISESGSIVKLLLVSSLEKNSPAGTYKFSMLAVGGKSGKAIEQNLDTLKADSRYAPFTKLSIVQSAASKPVVIDGNIQLVGILANQEQIDTGSGPATIDVQIAIKRSGAAAKWYLSGSVHAMYCKSGVIRKYKSIVNSQQNTDPIQAGEYCSELLDPGQGKKYWWPDMMASNTISTGGTFAFAPGVESTSVRLSIPSNFKKGTIIVGLDQMSLDVGDQKYAFLRGNWNAYTFHGSRNKYPSALSCGEYPSCTKYYSVVKNGD
jgi:hypothetical protein